MAEFAGSILPRFRRVKSPDGTFSSICFDCLAVVALDVDMSEVEWQEHQHVCTAEDLLLRARLERLARVAYSDSSDS